METCTYCGGDAPPGYGGICMSCRQSDARGQAMAASWEEGSAQRQAEWDREAQQRRQEANTRAREAGYGHAWVQLTTTSTFPNRRILDVVDVVGVECVLGMNLVRDFLAGVTDIVGGQSLTTQRAFADARAYCQNELRAHAAGLGANAVVGVRFDFGELSGAGKSAIFLAATGTAVVLEEPAGTLDDPM